MSAKVKYIITALFICAALSLATVSCMQLMSGTGKEFIDMSKVRLVQTEQPKEGDPTATIKTTMGDMSFVLYPEYAPLTVQHFTELAKSGYYNDTFVFQSELNVYFAAGSPNRNGDLDEDKPEGAEEWEQELSDNLWPFKGALCSLETGQEEGLWKKITGDAKVLNGSRFSVLGSVDFTEDFKKELLDAGEDKTLANKFIELGGVPALSRRITVFGQIYDGEDVAQKLMQLETRDTEDGLKIPLEDVKIKTVEIGTYSAK